MPFGPAARETVVAMLEAAAERHPDKAAMTFGGADVSYAELIERSRATAHRLVELGIGPGDKVALLMQNSVEHIATLFATAAIGAVETAINTAYRGEFLAGLLQRVDARMLLVDDDLLPQFVGVADQVPDLSTVLVRTRTGEDVTGQLPGRVTVGTTESLADGDRDSWPKGEPRWDVPSSIQYTSGTTGPSKAALMSQNYMVHLSREYSSWWYRNPDDVFYTGLPLFHGLAKILGVLGAIYRGATCVLDERFSLNGFWDQVRHYRATATACPEAVLVMLWNLPPSAADADNPLHTIVAAPIPADLHRAMEDRWGIRFVSQYSLSEASPLVVGGVDEPLKPGTAGKVRSEFYDVRLLNDDDEEVAPGEAGEVVVRPKRPRVMFDGYCGDPDATLSVWRNLWFHTGDVGRFDEDGNFVFVDRKKDYIRRRAENISSFEVQRAVAGHPAVADAAAIGVPSEYGEEEVMICVVLHPGATLDPDTLLAHCAENMPYYAIPRYIEFVDALPLTPSGKVAKFRLRERGVTDAAWDRETAGYRLDRKLGVVKAT